MMETQFLRRENKSILHTDPKDIQGCPKDVFKTNFRNLS